MSFVYVQPLGWRSGFESLKARIIAQCASKELALQAERAAAVGSWVGAGVSGSGRCAFNAVCCNCCAVMDVNVYGL